MGIISILLGVIAFFVFTGAGAIIANFILDWKAVLSLSLRSLEAYSNTTIMAVVVGVFAFIGLLICVSLVMQGLTYMKISKMQSIQRFKK